VKAILKAIEDDKNPRKLISFEEAEQAGLNKKLIETTQQTGGRT
jgi:hypothetical protein